MLWMIGFWMGLTSSLAVGAQGVVYSPWAENQVAGFSLFDSPESGLPSLLASFSPDLSAKIHAQRPGTQVFQLFYKKRKLFDTYVTLVQLSDHPVQISLSLSLDSLPPDPWLHESGYVMHEGVWHEVTERVVQGGDGPYVEYHNPDGELIKRQPLFLGFEQTVWVYPEGEQASSLAPLPLARLSPKGYLENADFAVYGGHDEALRVRLDGSQEFWDPLVEARLFDQLQSYYNAEKVVRFFQKVSLKWPDTPLAIYTHHQQKNVARYLPALASPRAKIFLGRGDGILRQNLARDPDVLTHEMAHHVVYQFLTHLEGVSGALHEGYADYFAYALAGDPYLAETVNPLEPSLRDVDQDKNFQNVPEDANLHEKGTSWAYALWQMRQSSWMREKSFDHVVARSLTYLSPRSHWQEAMFALLWADTEFYPQRSDPLGRGQHYCQMLDAFDDAGFFEFTAPLNRASCGVGLQKEKSPTNPSSAKSTPIACGTLGYRAKGGVVFLLIGPLLWLRRRDED